VEQRSSSEARAELLESLKRKLADDPADVVRQVRILLAEGPLETSAYRLLALALDEVQRRSGISAEVRTSVGSNLEQAVRALQASDFQTAGNLLLRRLTERPTDPDALSLMGELAATLNYDVEAEGLLRFALEQSPDLTSTRIELARLLDRQDRPSESRRELERVLAREPGNLFAKAVYAASLGRTGRYEEAVRQYEELLESIPDESALWTTYGNVLMTMGRSDDGVHAMRRAVTLQPANGEAWWNLANMKTARFDPADVSTMESMLGRSSLSMNDRAHISFALGKAFEDSGSAAQAFAHYERANALKRLSTPHDPDLITAEIDASIQLFSSSFFTERIGFGAAARDPIFIVGMPRAGSTLVEQILASHPAIEGTRELLDIPNIARELGYRRGDYFDSVERLDKARSRVLGETFLERTRIERITDRPLFIDKMPTNWVHVGLIHLLLPNAKIIDARRHPLACGFSNFKQSYARGHSFSYDLASIGHYYSNYVRLTTHFDSVLPGRIHRVFHERLVDDTEGEIRRLLDYIELPFDTACMRFFETDRAVRTSSAEQVRRPIGREHVEQWRAFDQWLDPLKAALGPALDSYPDVPE